MRQLHRETFNRANEGFKMNINLGLFQENVPMIRLAKGTFIFDMRDSRTGEQLAYWEKDNQITLDAGILAARLFRNSLDPNPAQNNGLTMLAIGTGADGNILNPDAPQDTQRALNTEIARKAFASTQFRNGSGIAVAYPTNVVDFTTTYGEAEAVGPLDEMGLICSFSLNPLVLNPIPAIVSGAFYDPTFDVTGYDILVNYLTFGVVTKPSSAILTITWRLTF